MGSLVRKSLDYGNTGVKLLMIGTSALMFWAMLKVVTDTESPIVVVLTGSMEPGFWRGDLLFLWHQHDRPYEIGDIVVYKLPGQPIPIVHRVHQIHHGDDGEPLYLTKGDNNPEADTLLYQRTDRRMEYLTDEQIIGRVVGYFPKLGYATIALNDYPWLKYVMFGAFGLMALTGND
ncbi:Peptidase S26B eukaryotic signal peptidase [Carpediemonas membranifera]|uniref:Signal peptidase complex catalytic subunit SEC11 n=1 Tax=Carpediemonas membranifera TaxID=201153 RepID=A0A8J6AV78_9EUKA|nr:Peptidase S26B eukaryotic signal peptidase [Carpediemonas membranifera]|eukprot:KAG9392415.1 Peptidase S26B eukaryotic signal peptidase [Carpediemonas membranifera]